MTIDAPCLMIAAGGTGGHIFPAVAVADCLREKGWRIVWLGSKGGLEERLVPMQNIELHLLPITGLRGKSAITLLAAPWRIFTSVMQARRLIRQRKVSVVLGMGGFASGPGGVAAKLTGTPLVLHEQNAIAGFTNRALARLANKVMAAFPNAFPTTLSVSVVGNPVRKNIMPKSEITRTPESSALRILVVGGSRGALALNQALPAIAPDLFAQGDISIWHQTGKNHKDDTYARYQQQLTEMQMKQVQVSEFIDDMANAYAWADVVVCRAGALTVSELAMVGLPAIFVPYPHAVDDHQFHNARFLADAGASWIVRQDDSMNEALTQQLAALMHEPKTLQKAAQMAKTLASPMASEHVAQACADLALGVAA